jgi:hypothetical protein
MLEYCPYVNRVRGSLLVDSQFCLYNELINAELLQQIEDWNATKTHTSHHDV